MTFVKKKQESKKTATRFLGVILRLDHDLSAGLCEDNDVQCQLSDNKYGSSIYHPWRPRGNQSGDQGLKKRRNNSCHPTVMTAPASPPNA